MNGYDLPAIHALGQFDGLAVRYAMAYAVAHFLRLQGYRVDFLLEHGGAERLLSVDRSIQHHLRIFLYKAVAAVKRGRDEKPVALREIARRNVERHVKLRLAGRIEGKHLNARLDSDLLSALAGSAACRQSGGNNEQRH